jgi:hypothetical protein
LRHIQRGNSTKLDSACSAEASVPVPRIQRFTRAASGQSPSTTTAVKPCSAISRCVKRARVS